MHYDAVIFDIDGTLWDASQASSEGWTASLTKLGIDREISPAEITSVTGNAYEQCVDMLLPGLRSKYPDLIPTLNDCEMAAVKSKGGVFYRGAIEGIRELSEYFKVFLVSNCQEWYLDLFLAFSSLEPVLAGFDCHGLSGLPKSSMLQRMKNAYLLNSPVYVGDTAGDQAAAELAGIEFIHVSWGFGTPEGKVKTFNSFAELVKYLKS